MTITDMDLLQPKAADSATPDLLQAVGRILSCHLAHLGTAELLPELLRLFLAQTQSPSGIIGEVQTTATGKRSFHPHGTGGATAGADTAISSLTGGASRSLPDVLHLLDVLLTTGQPAAIPGWASNGTAGPACLGLPFANGDRLEALVLLADRPGGYPEGMADDLRPLLVAGTTVLAAEREQREHRQVHEFLCQSAEWQDRLLEGQLDLFCHHLADGTLTYVNGAFTRCFGKARAQLIGRSLLDFVPAGWRELIQRQLGSLARQPQAAAHEHPVVRGDGSIGWYHWARQPIRDARGRVVEFQSVGRDLTDHRRAEEERWRIAARAQQAQRLECLEGLAGGIAHNFNNILQTVVGYADLLKADLPSGSPGRSHLELVLSGARRAADLTTRLSGCFAPGKPRLQPVLLNELILEMHGPMRVQLPRTCTLSYQLADSLPPIDGDPALLGPTIQQLVHNAREAIGEREGTIVLRTSAVRCNAAFLAQHFPGDSLPEGTYVSLEVADTGGGIPAEAQGRVFDPFYSTRFTGRGLGLWAVRGVVRAHGGAIRLTSEPGRGSTFQVLFPATGMKPDPTAWAKA